MATPVGHSLAGIALGRLGRHFDRAGWRWYALALLCANAPDRDLVPGLLIGDVDRFTMAPATLSEQPSFLHCS